MMVNELKQHFDLEKYLHSFGKLPAIWGITLLHIIAPDTYPIYDQHVHRSFKYILNGVIEKIPNSKESKYRMYFNEYVPFFRFLQNQVVDIPSKQLDDALWAFGRFLSLYPNIVRQLK